MAQATREQERRYIKHSLNRAAADIQDAITELIEKSFYDDLPEITKILLALKDWQEK